MRRLAAIAALASACAIAAPAQASELIDRNAQNATLQVNAKGEALITYRVGGRLRRVLAWGAMNAIPSTRSRKQVDFA